MYKYKSEMLNIMQEGKGIKFVKSVFDCLDIEKFDEFINKQAEEGWEIVTHSIMNYSTDIRAIVTFRKPV